MGTHIHMNGESKMKTEDRATIYIVYSLMLFIWKKKKKKVDYEHYQGRVGRQIFWDVEEDVWLNA